MHIRPMLRPNIGALLEVASPAIFLNAYMLPATELLTSG